MAENPGSSSGTPSMQPEQQHHGSIVDNLVGAGSVAPQGEPKNTANPHGSPQRELFIRQTPEYARVAMGKEKDRKPIDPPPIVELIDWRERRNRENAKLNAFEVYEYHNPYLFLTCTLVMEDFSEPSRDTDPLASYLCGTTTSSIHHHKDPSNMSCGFFVFGDLGVKREGRFRLRFTLYDRDFEANPPEFFFVAEIFSKVFTVSSPKSFPGMAESTPLTRCLSDQGVKLRLRKDSRAMKTRKRNQRTAETAELSRQGKRPHVNQTYSLRGFVSDGSNSLSSPEFMSTPDFGAVSGLPTSHSAPSAPNTSSNTPLEISPTGTFMSPPINSQFPPQGLQQLASMPSIVGATTQDMTGASIPGMTMPMMPEIMAASIPVMTSAPMSGINEAGMPSLTRTSMPDMNEAPILDMTGAAIPGMEEVSMPGMTGASMTPSAYYHHQGFAPHFGMDKRIPDMVGIHTNFVHAAIENPSPVPNFSEPSPYAVLPSHFGMAISEVAPRTSGVLDEVQHENMFPKPDPDTEQDDDQTNGSINHFGVFQ